MEHRQIYAQEGGASAQRLTDEALTQASGGVGYTSVLCKKCGKAFSDMEQYRMHVEAGCKPKPKR